MKQFFVMVALCAAMVVGAVSCKQSGGEELPAATRKGTIHVERFEGIDRGRGLERGKEYAGDLLLSVSNGLRSNVTLISGAVTVCYGGKPVCAFSLIEEVMLPKRVVSSVRIPVLLTLKSPVASYGLLQKVLRGEFDKITLTLEAEAKVGLVRKSIHKEGLPLREAMQSMGISTDTVKNIMKKS